MPPVDLETLVTACTVDRKIACESQADENPPENDVSPNEEVPPDFPPESFWLSKDAEYDWLDRNAFFERKDSTKGISNSTNLNAHVNPNNSNQNSQRFSVTLKSKASIIGLPKPQKATFADSKRRACKTANIRLFPPKRSNSAGKSTIPAAEPGSPKVSCIGRVRSKRGRRRSNSLKRIEKSVEKPKTVCEKQRTGFYSKVMSIFRSKKTTKKPALSGSSRAGEVLEDRQGVAREPPRMSVSVKVMTEPPSLGGMKQLASGRRSGSWICDDFNQADSDRRG